MKSAWRPIIEGGLRDEVNEVIMAVARVFRKYELGDFTQNDDQKEPYLSLRSPSLYGGQAGVAVFYTYLAQIRPGEGHEKSAVFFLNQAIQKTASALSAPSLSNGFIGVAWATEYIRQRIQADDLGDPNESVDNALRILLSRFPWKGSYDPINGLVGIGIYLLERVPDPVAVECLELIIEHLYENAEFSSKGTTWHTRPETMTQEGRELYPEGYYNLGLAHGLPGIISFLGRVCLAGISADRPYDLLQGAVSWLLSQKLNCQGSSFYMGIEKDKDREPQLARSAWCYGNPGIAAALLTAARCVKEPQWESEAIEIGRIAAERPPDEAGVIDSGICHGASGLGHIFNRIFQVTGETDFKHAAQYWFKRTVALRRTAGATTGFYAKTLDDDGEKIRTEFPGILIGAAGISMAFLGAISSIEPDWDRMILLSAPY